MLLTSANPSETLVQTATLLFPSLAVAFAFRAGLFNIGAEGQLVIGGLFAGIVGAQLSLGPASIPLILLAGLVGGGVWGAIAGIIRSRWEGNEIIATLMLTFLADLLANYLLSSPLRIADAVGSETPLIARSAWLPTMFPHSRLTLALPIGLALAFFLRFLFTRTVIGYELRAVGDAPEAARRAGIDPKRIAFPALAMSGAIAGLGGATIVDGILHRFNTELSPGYGFIAIAVALVGSLEPVQIIAASFLFGALQNGALELQMQAHIPKEIVTCLEGLLIVVLAARRRFSTSAAASA